MFNTSTYITNVFTYFICLLICSNAKEIQMFQITIDTKYSIYVLRSPE